MNLSLQIDIGRLLLEPDRMQGITFLVHKCKHFKSRPEEPEILTASC